jgi:hypothetical protein
MKYLIFLISIFLACPPSLETCRRVNAANFRAGMILGRWQTSNNQQLFFNQRGEFWLQSSGGNIAYHKFRVLSENTKEAEIEFLYNDDTSDLTLCTITSDSLIINFLQKDSIVRATFIDFRAPSR